MAEAFKDGVKLGAGYADLDPMVATDLVAANHILAENGVLDSFGHVSVRDPRNPNRYLQMQAMAPRDVTVARHHHLRSRQQRDRRQRPLALSRALHPWPDLQGAAGRQRGRAQPLADHHPVQRDREAVARDLPQRAFPRPERAGVGDPRARRRAEQHAGADERARPVAGAGAWQGLRHPDARPRQRGRRPRPQDHGIPRDLHRGQRQAADAGGDARRPDQFPQRVRRSSRRRTSTARGQRGRSR